MRKFRFPSGNQPTNNNITSNYQSRVSRAQLKDFEVARPKAKL